MPVDARIALGVEPVKMPDFAQLAVQRSAVMNNMAEMASKQRALNEQNMLAQLMQDPNFSFDSAESRKLVHTRAPNIGGTVLKSYDDATAARVKAVEDARVAKLNETVANVQRLSMFNTPDEVIADINKSTMDENLKQSLLASVPKDPTQFEPWRLGLLRKATEWLKPESGLAFTDTQVDSGDQTRMMRTMSNDPLGKPREVASFKEQPTPDQLLDNARAAANERDAAMKPFATTNAAGDVIVTSANVLNDPRINPTGASSIVIPGAGKPSGGFERAQAARGEAYSQISAALPVLDELLKPGSNLDKAEGGVPTVAQTLLARTFGFTTEQMKAQAKLGPEGYVLLQQVPRFEGPQSDKDTAAYKDAAGKLTDPFSTASEKRAALEAIKAILLRNKAYLDANPQSGAAKTGGGAASGVINWEDM